MNANIQLLNNYLPEVLLALVDDYDSKYIDVFNTVLNEMFDETHWRENLSIGDGEEQYRDQLEHMFWYMYLPRIRYCPSCHRWTDSYSMYYDACDICDYNDEMDLP
jgi:hypothetical protein